MQVDVAGIGIWGPGFSNYSQFWEFTTANTPATSEAESPRPELIPPRERRRSPLMVKLAVEVADQACAMAQVDHSALQCVFSSGIGDSDLTDYMCRVLAGPDKLLSPTKFHNSVHNAAVGYWSISTGCEQAATFVSSLDTSFSTALMETMVQVTSAQRPALMVMSDVPTPTPMWRMHPIDHMFALALVLCPAGTHAAPLFELNFGLQATAPTALADGQSNQWPELASPALQSLYKSNPSARGLCLLQSIAQATVTGTEQSLCIPVSDGLVAALTLASCMSKTEDE